MFWRQAEAGTTIGKTGSEDGVILRDELSAVGRLTLERIDGGYAITCSLYGTLFHTAWADSETAADDKFWRMRRALEQAPADAEGQGDWCEWFVNMF
ncbi:hypothetical protein [Lacticaseibacillus kribbianus]|uniref:hypothetical protein n=1 Tax=Lacticaseibacillus kribbianus TaxID=2926292 RepID=UPI001CD674A0|nr:hypothetical protein [Lacticaseibacillus kribbianus]